MNLADVPISLNLFNVWWFEKVITPQLDVYTVKSFVVDSINELILAAMGADCWVGETNFGKVGDTSKSSITPLACLIPLFLRHWEKVRRIVFQIKVA